MKKQIYPKTKRVKINNDNICQLTEKLDGSNLCLIKKDGTLYIAQRNNIFSISEMEDYKSIIYKGLYSWLNEHAIDLIESMHDNTVLCGEWLGMGNIKYDVGEFDKRFYMFAKANVTEDFELKNIFYYHDLFIYPFINQEIPKYIGVVPVIKEMRVYPSVQDLNSIYEKYCNSTKRNVEGIIVNYQNTVSKYVRMKNGKLQEHHE